MTTKPKPKVFKPVRMWMLFSDYSQRISGHEVYGSEREANRARSLGQIVRRVEIRVVAGRKKP